MPSHDRSPSASRSASGGCLFAAGVMLSAPLIIAAKWIAYSNFVIDHQVPLSPAIEAERVTFDSTAGRLSYYADRAAAGRPRGRPLLLIHSVNAAASAYEMRPIFDHFRGQRPLYALDLPGYGFSERTDRARSPEAYAQAIVDLIAKQIGEPVDAIARRWAASSPRAPRCNNPISFIRSR